MREGERGESSGGRGEDNDGEPEENGAGKLCRVGHLATQDDRCWMLDEEEEGGRMSRR